MAGRGLGTLTLDLVAKIGGFTGPLDKAGRELDAKTRAMHKRAQQFGRELGAVFKVGAGLAGAGLALYVKNTIEAEKVTAQLVSRLQDTQQVAGRSLEQLNAQAEKLQRLTVFDDESIGEAQAALLTFTEIRDLNFDRTIEAATDLATVMGTDVADAARVLGKALSDPEKAFGALRKAGIVLQEDQKALIKQFMETGDLVGAQGVILDALAGKMGTAAEAARNTLGGALKALQNSINELLEGDGGDAGVRDATQAINDLTDSMNSSTAKQNIDALINGLVAITGVVADLVSGFIKGAQQVGNFMGFIGNSVGDFVAMNKAFYSGDLEGALAARRKLLGEYAAFNEETKRTRGDFDRRAAAAGVPAGRPRGPAFVNGGSTTIHGGADFGSGAKKTGGGAPKISEAQRAAEQLEQAYVRMNAQMAESITLFGQTTEVAKLRYDLENGELAKASEGQKQTLMQKAQILDQLAAEKKLLDERNKAEAEKLELQIKARESVTELLSDMQFELDLLGKANAERIAENELRRIGIGLTAEEVAAAKVAIEAKAQQYEATMEQVAAFDEFRRSFEDNVASVLDGSKSITDALKDMVDDFVRQIARMLAQQWTKQLFGEMGGTGTGQSGGFLSAIFGSFFGGARALGGPVASGVPYLVGERGPEIMVPRSAGEIIPNHRMKAGGGVNQNLNFMLAAPTDPRTQQQIAAKTGYQTRRALSRSGA